MGEENIFESTRMKEAMDKLLKSEAGREMAGNLRSKLKELGEQYKGLSGDDKKEFLEDFQSKLQETLGGLNDALKVRSEDEFNAEFRTEDDSESMPPVYARNYLPVLIAVVLLLLLFGCCSKLFKLKVHESNLHFSCFRILRI